MGELSEIFAFDSYRSLLEHVLRERSKRNPRYSMRAFARDLGIRSNRLCEILSGKQGLSRESAQWIGERLELKESELDFFIQLVVQAHARRKSERNWATQKVEDYRKSLQGKEKNEKNALIKNWQHYAILELGKLPSFRPDTAWISKALGLDNATIEQTLLELKELGLLTARGKSWIFTPLKPTEIKPEILEAFHLALMSRCIELTGLKLSNKNSL